MLLQVPLDRRALPGIETGKRLVQQKDVRIRRHGARDERAPQLSVGQFARPARCL